MFGVCVVGERYIHKADRFLFAAAPRSGYSGYRQTKICPRALADSLGHRFGNRRADGAMFKQQHRLDAQRSCFRVVRIRDNSLDKVLRRTRNLSQSLRN